MSDFSITIESAKGPEPDSVQVNLTRLSHKTGYSISHLSRVVSRETRPSIRCLVKISNSLGVTLDNLHKMIQEGNISVSKVG